MRETSDVSPPLAQANSTPSIPPLSPAQFAKLCDNEYSRYEMNSDVVAHALIRHNKKETPQSIQFQLPDQLFESAGVPMVGHLQNIQQIQLPHNKSSFVGKVGNTEMLSKRSYEIHIEREDSEEEIYTFHPFSPRKNLRTQETRSIIYDTTPVKRFADTEEAKEIVAQFTPPRRKTSDELSINIEHIKERLQVKYRKPDQNTVMGRHHYNKETRRQLHRHKKATRATNQTPNINPSPGRKTRSAVTEMADLANDYGNILTDEMIQLLNESANAPLTQRPAGQARAEWLHRHSHNLHPLHIDPQHENNLGAASKRYNTEMMILERIIQFFALNVAQSTCKIHAEFDMLLDSEVIDKINFSVFIQLASIKIKLVQHIDAFQKEPQHVKSSDLASLVGILHHFINGSQPRSIQPITQAQTNCNVVAFSGNFFNRVKEVKDDDDDLTLLQSNHPK